MSRAIKCKFNIDDVIVCKDLKERPIDVRFDLFKITKMDNEKVVAQSSKGIIEIPLGNLNKYEEVFNVSWYWKYKLDNLENYTNERYSYDELDRYVLFERAEPMYDRGFTLC